MPLIDLQQERDNNADYYGANTPLDKVARIIHASSQAANTPYEDWLKTNTIPGQIEEDTYQREVQTARNQDIGMVREFGRGLGRGTMQGLPEAIGQSLQLGDRVISDEGEQSTLGTIGKAIEAFGTGMKKKMPGWEPSKKAEVAGSWQQAASSAGESTPLSLAPATVGLATSALTGGNLALGGIAAAGSMIPLFYGATTEQKLREGEAAGLSKEDNIRQANISGASEYLTELASDAVAALTFGALGTPAKEAVKRGVGGVIKEVVAGKSLKELMKDLLVTGTFESGSEVLNAYIQGESDKAVGLNPGQDTGESMLEAAKSAAVMTLVFNAVGIPYGYKHAADIRKTLLNPEAPEKQIKAAIGETARGINEVDPELAVLFTEQALKLQAAGKPIIFDDDAYYQQGVAREDAENEMKAKSILSLVKGDKEVTPEILANAGLTDLDAPVVATAKQAYEKHLGAEKDAVANAPSEAMKQGILAALEKDVDGKVLETIRPAVGKRAVNIKDLTAAQKDVDAITSELNVVSKEVEDLDIQKDGGRPINDERHATMIARQEELNQTLAKAVEKRDALKTIQERLTRTVTIDDAPVAGKPAPIEGEVNDQTTEQDMLTDVESLRLGGDPKAFAKKYGNSAAVYALRSHVSGNDFSLADFKGKIAEGLSPDNVTSIRPREGVTTGDHEQLMKERKLVDTKDPKQVQKFAKTLGIEIVKKSKDGKDIYFGNKSLIEKIDSQLAADKLGAVEGPRTEEKDEDPYGLGVLQDTVRAVAFEKNIDITELTIGQAAEKVGVDTKTFSPELKALLSSPAVGSEARPKKSKTRTTTKPVEDDNADFVEKAQSAFKAAEAVGIDPWKSTKKLVEEGSAYVDFKKIADAVGTTVEALSHEEVLSAMTAAKAKPEIKAAVAPETIVETSKVETPKGMPELIPRNKPVFHKSSNLESIKGKFEQRDLGISFAKTPEGTYSSPQLAENLGTIGQVTGRVEGKGLNYARASHRDFIESLFDEAEQHEGPRDIYVLNKLRSLGVDFVENYNGIGKDDEIHVLNANAVKDVKTTKTALEMLNARDLVNIARRNGVDIKGLSKADDIVKAIRAAKTTKAPSAVIPLDTMSTDELKTTAKDNNVDITGLTSHDDIKDAIAKAKPEFTPALKPAKKIAFEKMSFNSLMRATEIAGLPKPDKAVDKSVIVQRLKDAGYTHAVYDHKLKTEVPTKEVKKDGKGEKAKTVPKVEKPVVVRDIRAKESVAKSWSADYEAELRKILKTSHHVSGTKEGFSKILETELSDQQTEDLIVSMVRQGKERGEPMVLSDAHHKQPEHIIQQAWDAVRKPKKPKTEKTEKAKVEEPKTEKKDNTEALNHITRARALNINKYNPKEVRELASFFSIPTIDSKGNTKSDYRLIADVKGAALSYAENQMAKEADAKREKAAAKARADIAAAKEKIPGILKNAKEKKEVKAETDHARLVERVVLSDKKITATQQDALIRIANGDDIRQEGSMVSVSTLNALTKKGYVGMLPSGQWVLQGKFADPDAAPLSAQDAEIMRSTVNRPKFPGEPQSNYTVIDIVNGIKEVLGTNKVPSIFEIYNKQSDLPFNYFKGRIEATYYKGKIYIIANEVLDIKNTIRGVLVHEGLHYLRRQDSTWSKKWNEMYNYITYEAQKTQHEQRAFDKAKARLDITIRDAIEVGQPMSEPIIQEELLSYYLQEIADDITVHPENARQYSLWEHIVRMINALMFKLTGRTAKELDLTPQDIADLIIYDLGKLAEVPTEQEVEGAMPLASYTQPVEGKDYETLNTENGYLDYHEEDGKVVLRDIHVDKATRRQGTGTKLINELISRFPDKQIVLGAVSKEMDALAQKIGFELISPKNKFMPEGQVPDIVNSKTMNTWLYDPNKETPLASPIQARSRLETEFVAKRGPQGKLPTSEQWIKTVDSWLKGSMPGPVKEEVFWSDLREWLLSKPGENVTKDEVLDYLSTEGLKTKLDVKTTSSALPVDPTTGKITSAWNYDANDPEGSVKGLVEAYRQGLLEPGSDIQGAAQAFWADPEVHIDTWLNGSIEDINPDAMRAFDAIQAIKDTTETEQDMMNDMLHGIIDETTTADVEQELLRIFSTSDEPGIKRVTERLKTNKALRNTVISGIYAYKTYAKRAEYVRAYVTGEAVVQQLRVAYSNYSLLPKDKAKEILNIELSIPNPGHGMPNYTRGHFTETKNQIAWARCIVLPSGEMFVNEIQSDIHNTGKKYGYITPESAAEHAQKMKEYKAKLKAYKEKVAKENAAITEAVNALRKHIIDKYVINFADLESKHRSHIMSKTRAFIKSYLGSFNYKKPKTMASRPLDKLKAIVPNIDIDEFKRMAEEYRPAVTETLSATRNLWREKPVAPEQSNVPEFPFKDNYVPVMFKEVIKESVARGIDTILWPSSPTQVQQVEQWAGRLAYSEVKDEDTDTSKWMWNITGTKVGGSVRQLIEVLTNSVKKQILPYGGELGTVNKPEYIKLDLRDVFMTNIEPVPGGFLVNYVTQTTFDEVEEGARNAWEDDGNDPDDFDFDFDFDFGYAPDVIIPHLFKTEDEALAAAVQLERGEALNFTNAFNALKLDDKLVGMANKGELPLASLSQKHWREVQAKLEAAAAAQKAKDFANIPATEAQAQAEKTATAETIANKTKDAELKEIADLHNRIMNTVNSEQGTQEFDDPKKGIQAYKRTVDTQDTNIFTRIFSLPEYYMRRDKTAEKILEWAQRQNEFKTLTENTILGKSFVKVLETAKKNDPAAYKKAADYLLDTDKTGLGYSIREVKGEWHVFTPIGRSILTFTNEQEAVKAMVEQEQIALRARGFSKSSLDIVKEVRDLTNRGFEIIAQDMRRQITLARENGLAEPTTKHTNADGKEGKIKLSEAIALIGDLRGTFFPRERPQKSYVLTAQKPGINGKKVLIPIDMYLPGNELDGKFKAGIKDYINSKLPIAGEIKKLLAQGFKEEEISINPVKAIAEVVFDTPGLLTSTDSLISAALENIDKKEMTDVERKLLEGINAKLAYNIGNIYKAKGSFSSRLKRSESHWEGYETDPLKALTSYTQRLAAGAARRAVARGMLEAFTGRDVSFEQFKKSNPGANYNDYRSEVKRKAISATEQPNLYADVRLYMNHVLRPDNKVERFVGYLKGLTVLKFLGFRFSSAAVNATNMAFAMPATMSAHTGLSIPKCWSEITSAAAKYAKFRAATMERTGTIATAFKEHLGKMLLSDEDFKIFETIAMYGWDEANFNQETVRVLQNTANETWNNTMHHAMFMFGAVERANRAISIFASVKAHQKAYAQVHKGAVLPMQAALRKAFHTSNRAHGEYGKGAKPWLVQKVRLLDMPYTFFKFQQNYMLNMLELGMKYNKWGTAVPYMLMSPAILAGAGTTLVTPVIAAAVKALGGGDDPEEDFYAWAEEAFGSDAFARHGIAGLLNINFKGSLEITNPFPDLTKGYMGLMGPAGGVFLDIADSYDAFKDGQWSKGVEKLLPTAAGSTFKGYREMTEGVTDKNYAPVFYGTDQLKGTPMDFALRVLSFNPGHISGIREKLWREESVQKAYQKERTNIIEHFNMLFTDIDKATNDDFADLYRRIDEYNKSAMGADPKYQVPVITNKWIQSSLKRTQRPDKHEKARTVN